MDEVVGSVADSRSVFIFGKGPSLNWFGGDFAIFKDSPCISVNDAFFANPWCRVIVFHHNFVITRQSLPYLIDPKRFVLTVSKDVHAEEEVVDPQAYQQFWESGNYAIGRFVQTATMGEAEMETVGSDAFDGGEPLIFPVTFLSAIRLAYLMGSRDLILLGFDFDFTDTPYESSLPDLTRISDEHKRVYFAWYRAIYQQVRLAATARGIRLRRVGEGTDADIPLHGLRSVVR